jgi:hypothetical protein
VPGSPAPVGLVLRLGDVAPTSGAGATEKDQAAHQSSWW